MARAHHLLAVWDGIKTKLWSVMTEAYKNLFPKVGEFTGFERTFHPLMETLNDRPVAAIPPESKKTVRTVAKVIEGLREPFIKAVNTAHSLEQANSAAKENIVVDDVVLAEDVPVNQLLWLKKVMDELETLAETIPTLSADQDWTYFDNGLFVAPTKQSFRTAKVLRSHVKYEATEHHPAQVDSYTEDVPTHAVSTRDFSGACRADDKAEVLDRIAKLKAAILYARENANNGEAQKVKVAKAMFEYIFEPLLIKHSAA